MNIWRITNGLLIEVGEKDSSAYSYPQMEKIEGRDSFVYPHLIFNQDGMIKDPNFAFPYSKELDSYLFGLLAPHYDLHVLFFKEEKWAMINMRKPLLDIISQSIELCRKLELDDKDSSFVFKEVLRYHEEDAKNIGGTPISVPIG